MLRPRRWDVLALVSSALLLTAGCRASPPTSALPADTNILLIVLDACRADKLGSYGFERETSPNIDALAGDPDAVVFQRHYVQGTWTKPSTASLFTGLFVHQHGMTKEHRNHGGAAGRSATQVLADSFYTMAERLRDRGFTTLGVVKSPNLRPEAGFAQGFAQYDGPHNGVEDDPALVERFLSALAQPAGRMFAYLHLNACHRPIAPEQRDPEYMSRYGGAYDEAARIAAGLDFASPNAKSALKGKDVKATPADVQFLHLIYEAQLRWTDRHLVGPILQRLRAIGRYDNSLIVVTADHGEELYEHHGYGHGHALWEPIIHVPLIVKFPKGHKPPALSHDVRTLTNSVDLLPSFLALTGAAAGKDLAGRSIFDGSEGGYAFAEQATARGNISEWALLRGDSKLLFAPNRSARLFDLLQDPLERSDVGSIDSDQLSALRRFGESLQGPLFEAPVVDVELPAKAVEQLRHLGYLEGNR